MGSRIRRSACGMNLSTFCPCANAAGMPGNVVMASATITAVIKRNREQRLFIANPPEIDNFKRRRSRGRFAMCLLLSLEADHFGLHGREHILVGLAAT